MRSATLVGKTPISLVVSARKGEMGLELPGVHPPSREVALNRLLQALKNQGFKTEKERVLTVNTDLTSSDVAHLLLPLAVSYLRSTRQAGGHLDDHLLFGGLTDDGATMENPSALALSQADTRAHVLCGRETAQEVRVYRQRVQAATDLRQAARISLGLETNYVDPKLFSVGFDLDFEDVIGEELKEVLLSALRLGGNILLEGPPGSGKTMIVLRLPHVIKISWEASKEVNILRSMLGLSLLPPKEAPLRSPHRTISLPAMLGGENYVGELDRAKHGILYLEDASSFERSTLKAVGIHSRDRDILVVASTSETDESLKRRLCGDLGIEHRVATTKVVWNDSSTRASSAALRDRMYGRGER